MKPTEALQALIAADPARSYYAEVEHWATVMPHRTPAGHEFTVTHAVSVLPGIGEPCSRFEASSLKEAVEDALWAVKEGRKKARVSA